MPSGADIESPHTRRDPFNADPGQSEYDAIAELFLGGDPAPQTPRPPEARPGTRLFEAVVLGHLPGAASAWVAQYAGAVAEVENKPVALIRTAEGELSVEIIGETDAAPRAASLDEAISTIQSRTARTLLRLDGADGDELPLDRIDAITILTGADDAAIVAAYQTLKSLCANERLNEATQIRAAIMGADAPNTDRAIEQLRRAVSAFLRGQLTQAPGVHRIGPVARTTVYRAPYTESAGALIARLRAPATTPSPRESSVQTEWTTPTPQQAEPAPSASPVVSSPAPPQPTPAVALAARVPNVIALESRCPYHEHVELAAGLTGELHALLEGDARCVDELLAVESWAKDHAKLLAKAEPALRAPNAEAALHLFTDAPAGARHLLNTKLRIHVLAKPGPDGYVCLPLNHGE